MSDMFVTQSSHEIDHAYSIRSLFSQHSGTKSIKTKLGYSTKKRIYLFSEFNHLYSMLYKDLIIFVYQWLSRYYKLVFLNMMFRVTSLWLFTQLKWIMIWPCLSFYGKHFLIHENEKEHGVNMFYLIKYTRESFSCGLNQIHTRIFFLWSY